MSQTKMMLPIVRDRRKRPPTSFVCVSISRTMRISRLERTVRRMKAYSRGGFVDVIDGQLEFAEAVVRELAGGDKDKVLVLSSDSALEGAGFKRLNPRVSVALTGFPSWASVVLVLDVEGFRVYREFGAACPKTGQAVWVVYGHRQKNFYVVSSCVHYLWGYTEYTPWISHHDFVTDVVVYDQPESERYVSFLQVVTNAFCRKKTLIEEMAFMPHLAFAKMVMNGDKYVHDHIRARRGVRYVSDHVRARRASEIPETSVRLALVAIFGDREFGHLELLSDPECIYSCGRELRRVLGEVPRGEAVVAVRNAQYVAYARTTVGGLAPVLTFTQLLKVWGKYKQVFLPMGISDSHAPGKNLMKKMREPGDHRVVEFAPAEGEVAELGANRPYMGVAGVNAACVGIAREFKLRESLAASA
ncbi:hypothetical protein [European catfish virus]|uniref:Uncharacterized protein n=1 Tax=European catfish virus TaxID=84739 RepID=A0A165Y8A4_9VIRU|nr:hypothetical protein [European catfish virus]AMZ05077.1 hypothetical protein [European catfish virus]